MTAIIRLGYSLVIAAGLLASGPVLAPRPAASLLGVAQAAEDIRTSDDPCFWTQMPWPDMSPAEQKLWSALGWTQDLWEGDPADYPASETADWSALTSAQKAAATKLGFNEQSWNDRLDATCE